MAGSRCAHLTSARRGAPDRPDFASVNISEPGFAELLDLLHSARIGVEVGVWSVADARVLAAADRGTDRSRILVEIMDEPAGPAPGTAHVVLDALDQLRVPGPRLLHG